MFFRIATLSSQTTIELLAGRDWLLEREWLFPHLYQLCAFPSLASKNREHHVVLCPALMNRKLSVFHLSVEHLFVLLCELSVFPFCLFIHILPVF